ncbi:diguanylate cyclase [Pseudomonas sp. J452]|uniref:diguanylate cyclase n=1 Tax=Pseudomonas sp. J452 TaxID=2898441 RepID=UPI0021AE2018|nr:diguanylate cyclase [Pseudomonas sp. J452]UUY06490.1 diguanylate cyclase [Pseudomonas sp. J452]
MEFLLTQYPRRPRLLLVDDQRINIQALYALFREQCDVFMATSGEQALQQCQKQLPDLILLDVVMPDMDGHAVCRQLKADPLTQHIPIIFITAQKSEADEVKCFELGAVDFISKPINPVIVQARVRTQLTLKLQSDLLRTQALLDGLTGVANRRRFEEELQNDWRQCLREQSALSVILLDIDHFKAYNDHYGHQRGDSTLRQVAQALAATLCRPYDLLARYGGEEFVCLLPGTGLAGAVAVAQKMEEQVRKLGLEHQGSSVAKVVTISLGVVSLVPGVGMDPQALVAAADAQLYEAKRGGRAQVSSSAGCALEPGRA